MNFSYYILGITATAYGFSCGNWYAAISAGGVASVIVAIGTVIF